MSRRILLVGIVLMLSWGVSSPSYGWGSATHAYIVREVAGTPDGAELRRIYGSVLPDAFNLMFGDPYQEHLWTQTHYEFMKLVEKAESDWDKALAYGLASHNEAWGADRTAHISAVTYPDSGYVIGKRDELAAILRPQVRLFLVFSGVPNASAVVDQMLPTVADSAVETAIDLLIRQNEDPKVGERLALAAQARGLSVPILLSKAFANDFAATAGLTDAEATSLIVAAETEFRNQIELYGTVLAQAEPLDALSEQGADLARLLFAAEHGTILDVPADLMKGILEAAIDVVKDDYAAEVQATIASVRQELASHGVTRSAW